MPSRSKVKEAPLEEIDALIEVESPDEDLAIPGSLMSLSQERLAWLVDRACRRIEECRADMGIEFGAETAQSGSWMWDRQVARMHYDGNVKWRSATGGVFAENNWSLNVPKRFVRLMAAKINNDLFGTQPFFAAMPENNDTPDISKQVESKAQSEVRQSNLPEVLHEATQVALAIGECAVKLTHVKDQTAFIGPARVAVDESGAPIKTPNGEYIFEKDDFIQTPEGELRLKKDLAFIATAPLQFMDFDKLTQTITHKHGLDAGIIKSEDFIWPIKCPRLEDADIMAHCYDESLEKLQADYGYLQTVKELSPTGNQSSQQKPILEMGEIETHASVIEKVNVHECYIRCDADQDGQEEWIFLVLDYRSRSAVYVEYLGNMRMKSPPFRLIRGVEKVAGRAYGTGVYKMFEQKNLFIDVCFNRIALKSSKEGSVTCVHNDFSEETKAGQPFTIGSKKVYHIPANSQYSKDRPGVYRINLNEVDEYSINLMEQMIQTGQLEFGIVSAADGEAANLNASGTATGIRNIERTGNLLQRATENMIASDAESLLGLAVDLILENMPAEELQYTPGADSLATLNRDEIRALEKDVRLLLTKARSEESLAVNAQVVSLIEKYYAYPKWMQKEVRSFFVDQLKVLEVQDADQRLKEPTDEDIAQESQAKSTAGKKPPTESIQAKFGDLPPELQQAFARDVFGMDFPITVFQAHAANIQAAKQPLKVQNGNEPQSIPGVEAA